MKQSQAPTLLFWMKGEARRIQRDSPPNEPLAKLAAAQEAVARKFGFTTWHIAVDQAGRVSLLNEAEVRLFPTLGDPERDFLLRQRAREFLGARWPYRSVEVPLEIASRRAVGPSPGP